MEVEICAEVSKLQNIFSHVNKSKYHKVSDLKSNCKYYVHFLERVRIVHGDRIITMMMTLTVTLDDDFKCFLLASWADKLTDDDLNHMNIRYTWFYVVYRGLIQLANGKSKHDIEFTMDSN